MDTPVISKNLFINSENKNQIMSRCLEIFVEMDLRCQEIQREVSSYGMSEEIRCKVETLEQEYQSQRNWIQNKNDRDIQIQNQKAKEIRSEIEKIKSDVEKKLEKLELMRTLTVNRQTYLENASQIAYEERQQQIALLQNDLDNMEERIRGFILEMNDEIAWMNQQLQDITEKQRMMQNERQKLLSRLQEEQEQHKRQILQQESSQRTLEVMKEVVKQIPPVIFNSIVSAMEKFNIRELKWSKKYVRQCQLGVIRHACSESGSKNIGTLYPCVCKEEQLEIPYIIGRNHAIYQMFLYKNEDSEIAWQHFQTLCLGQLVLHRGFDYELVVLLDEKENDRQFLSDIREFDIQASIQVIKPQDFMGVMEEIHEYCVHMQEEVLQEYNTVWNYNSSHPNKRLPYKGIALWGFPLGINRDILNYIYDMYNILERCGIFFMFMVNMGLKAEDERAVQAILDGLNPLEYNPVLQGYEDMGNRDYVVYIEQYKNL